MTETNTLPVGSREFRFARLAEIFQDDPASVDHGVDADELTDDLAVVTMTVRPQDANGHGICHGGLVFFLGDTAAAFATNTGESENLWVTSSSNVTFLKPARLGETLRAYCRPRWAGTGRMRIYDTEIHNPAGETVALIQSQMMRTRPSTPGDAG